MKANNVLGCFSNTISKQVEESDPSPLFSTSETTSGELCVVWGSPGQERL